MPTSTTASIRNVAPTTGVPRTISHGMSSVSPTRFSASAMAGGCFADLTVPGSRVYTSTYRRAIDTAAVAFAGLEDGWPMRTPLLDEQHLGDATYMTKDELFATYPAGAEDRELRKHLWVPPGGGESLAKGSAEGSTVVTIARADLQANCPVVAITHHTTILALRAILEQRPVADLVEEARKVKTPSAGIFPYELAAGASGRTVASTTNNLKMRL